MDVFIERTGETRSIAFSGTAAALLDVLAIHPETVLVLSGDILITLDEHVGDAPVRILSVVSGG